MPIELLILTDHIQNSYRLTLKGWGNLAVFSPAHSWGSGEGRRMPLPPKPLVCVELLFFFSAGRGGWELVVTEFPVQTFIGYKIECLI